MNPNKALWEKGDFTQIAASRNNVDPGGVPARVGRDLTGGCRGDCAE